MKKFFLALIIGFFMCYVVNSNIDATQTALADGVIRLHVIANSDDDSDQKLKLKVRDRILKETGNSLSQGFDMDTVSYEICKNLDFIKAVALDEVKKNGYDYDIKVSFGLDEFPKKEYGDITLPAGMYQALKVEIGKAEGQNWWCVMFPPLCFVGEEAVSMDEKFLLALQNGVGESAYNMISDKNSGYNVKLKFYELWKQGQKLIASKINK